MQYYIFSNGVQLGPYSKEELTIQGLTPDSIVWREGLSEWVKASSLPDLADILRENAAANNAEQIKNQYPNMAAPAPQQPSAHSPGQYQQGNPPYNPYGQPSFGYGQPFPIPHTNWMPWAIITTILSACSTCIGLILGIISIVYASKANTFYANGQQAEGDAANNTAKTLTIINIVLIVLGIIGSIAYFSFFAGSVFPLMDGYVD